LLFETWNNGTYGDAFHSRLLEIGCCVVKIVADENVQKNMNQMSKSLKQVEIDVKNAQKDKTAEANDKFVPVMTISLSVLNKCCRLMK